MCVNLNITTRPNECLPINAESIGLANESWNRRWVWVPNWPLWPSHWSNRGTSEDTLFHRNAPSYDILFVFFLWFWIELRLSPKCCSFVSCFAGRSLSSHQTCQKVHPYLSRGLLLFLIFPSACFPVEPRGFLRVISSCLSLSCQKQIWNKVSMNMFWVHTCKHSSRLPDLSREPSHSLIKKSRPTTYQAEKVTMMTLACLMTLLCTLESSIKKSIFCDSCKPNQCLKVFSENCCTCEI